jgi:hypothetical protein
MTTLADLFSNQRKAFVSEPLADEQTQLQNAKLALQNKGIPADNAEKLLRNLGLDLANQKTQGTLQGDIAGTNAENQGRVASLPEYELKGQEAQLGKTFLAPLLQQSQPQQAPQSFGVLKSDQNGPLASMFNPGQAQQPGQQPAPQGPQNPMEALAAKPLAELRQMRASYGPEGDFIGKYIDPIIAKKSFAEEVAPAMQEISQAAQMPGGTKEEARLKASKISTIQAKYPHIINDPGFKDMVTTALTKNTDFNPIINIIGTLRPQMNAESRISGENQKQSGDYEKVKGPALAFAADYDNYKKQIASGNKQAIKIAQQGMTDKYITTSTQKATGDAQFNNFIVGQGIQNALQNLGDKLKDGSMAPEKVFDTMRDITMATADKFRQKVQQTNAMTRKQADKENKSHGFNIDPEALITHPDEMLSQDSVAFSAPAGQQQGIKPGTVKTNKQGAKVKWTGQSWTHAN